MKFHRHHSTYISTPGNYEGKSLEVNSEAKSQGFFTVNVHGSLDIGKIRKVHIVL